MHIYHNDLHLDMEDRLKRRIMKNFKLAGNIKAGHSDKVCRVNAAEGVVIEMACFNTEYLNRYYLGPNFNVNADKFLQELAKLIKGIAVEINQLSFTIEITIKLPPKALSKSLKFDNSRLYVTI